MGTKQGGGREGGRQPQGRGGMEALAKDYADANQGGSPGSESESGESARASSGTSSDGTVDRRRRRRRQEARVASRGGDETRQSAGGRGGVGRARSGARALPEAADMLARDRGGLRKDAAVRGRLAGRVRTFPHVAGNFPTTVYVPIRLVAAQREVMNAAYAQLRAVVGPGLQPLAVGGGLSPGDFLEGGHISLSRTVPTRREQREALLGALSRELQGGTAAVGEPFSITFKGLEVFENDEGTRCFVAFPLSGGLQSVLQLISSVDEAFRALGLPEYYSDPRPHLTFAWAEGALAPALRSAAAAASRSPGGLAGGAGFRARAGSVRALVGAAAFTVWPHGPARVPD